MGFKEVISGSQFECLDVLKCVGILLLVTWDFHAEVDLPCMRHSKCLPRFRTQRQEGLQCFDTVSSEFQLWNVYPKLKKSLLFITEGLYGWLFDSLTIQHAFPKSAIFTLISHTSKAGSGLSVLKKWVSSNIFSTDWESATSDLNPEIQRIKNNRIRSNQFEIMKNKIFGESFNFLRSHKLLRCGSAKHRVASRILALTNSSKLFQVFVSGPPGEGVSPFRLIGDGEFEWKAAWVVLAGWSFTLVACIPAPSPSPGRTREAFSSSSNARASNLAWRLENRTRWCFTLLFSFFILLWSSRVRRLSLTSGQAQTKENEVPFPKPFNLTS